jgi:hypothetical protein
MYARSGHTGDPNRRQIDRITEDPLSPRKHKPIADEWYVPVLPFATDAPEPGTVVRDGDRLRGDNPVVRMHGERFVPASTPAEEIHWLAIAALPGGDEG